MNAAGLGLGSIALSTLLAESGSLRAATESSVHASGQLDPKKLSGPAKSIILLFMGGGPSQVDTFDPKSELTRLHSQRVPDSIAAGVPKVSRQRLDNLYASPYEFKNYGQSGLPVSSLYAETARCIDDICVIRSMKHTSPVHTPAEYLATTGSLTGTRPSLGAWAYYGLGSENRDLPGFVVMLSGENYGGPACWGNGFLPAKYQGTVVQSKYGIPNVTMTSEYSSHSRRTQLDVLKQLNELHQTRVGPSTELEARIASYELAFRMQSAAPEAWDISQESQETQQLYGVDRTETAEYGRNCLLARRLVERGVRFIQVNQGGWDAHGNLKKNHDEFAQKTDRPIAGLLTDLKRRGLLDSTLVIWGGEFGRTPTAEGSGQNPGRDHCPGGYTTWLAGAGVRGGQVIGATDDVGYAAVQDPVHPNDLHATMLHALGVDQRELYFEHNNRREIVTFNGGNIVHKVFGG